MCSPVALEAFVALSQRCQSPRHQPLFDVHRVTGASIEVFYADGLATFGRGGAGWCFWPRRRGFAPNGPCTRAFSNAACSVPTRAQLNGPLTPSDLPLVLSVLRACSAANGSRTSPRFSCANHVTWNSGHRMTRHSKPRNLKAFSEFCRVPPILGRLEIEKAR